jgi:hypothetical protein
VAAGYSRHVGIVVVEKSGEAGGAILVATARGGRGVDRSTSPFAFAEATDARFVACLCDGLDESPDVLAARQNAAREVVARASARPTATIAESIACGLGPKSSTALVVVASESVHVGWSGALEVIIVRDHAVLHRTVSRAMTGATPPSRAPGIDLAGPWATATGDLVLLCSANVQRVLSEADVTALASRDDLATIVRGLVTTASTRADFVTLCAVALRVVRVPVWHLARRKV